MDRIICFLIGYVFGNFPTGYLLGKFYGVDITKKGSGNVGTTNVLRNLGPKAGIITLTLNEGAYTAAFVKGGIEAVDKGQMEAARSLGLSFGKAMKKIILPQGIKIMVPSFVNQFIITLKDTSILSIIGILELTQTGKIIIARNLEGFKVWAIIGLMYLIVITVLTWISNYLQKKMNN